MALPHQPGKPLLNVLRESKIYVEAHCREGFCGACRTKMVSGEVHYENMPLACLNEGGDTALLLRAGRRHRYQSDSLTDFYFFTDH